MTDEQRMNAYDHFRNDRGSPSIDSVVAGALFDFCAFLTYQKGTLQTGQQHECSPIVEALEAWAKKRDLCLKSAAVKGWQDVRLSLVDHCAPQINQLAKYVLEYLPEEIKHEGVFDPSAVDIVIRVLQRGSLPKIVLCPTCKEKIYLNELTKQKP